MNLPIHCAYNQTRECFLGLEVTPIDKPREDIAETIKALAIQPGEGLWIAPFRGMPPAGLPAPLDWIYLDDACRVLDLVESFPTVRVNPSSPEPASVLAVPAHSIYASQTQLGDQLLVCAGEEMERRLEWLAGGSTMGSIPTSPPLEVKPLWSDGRDMVECESDISRTLNGSPKQGRAIGLLEPASQSLHAPRNWLVRWLSPDPRKAPRGPAPGLAAYYWTGAPPEAHRIRDVSSSGLFLVTDERWYLGTRILITLQRMGCGEGVAQRFIAVQSRAVRWGQDGVGLQLELPNARDMRHGRHPLLDGIGRKEFDRFLEQLWKGE